MRGTEVVGDSRCTVNTAPLTSATEHSGRWTEEAFPTPRGSVFMAS